MGSKIKQDPEGLRTVKTIKKHSQKYDQNGKTNRVKKLDNFWPGTKELSFRELCGSFID